MDVWRGGEQYFFFAAANISTLAKYSIKIIWKWYLQEVVQRNRKGGS